MDSSALCNQRVNLVAGGPQALFPLPEAGHWVIDGKVHPPEAVSSRSSQISVEVIQQPIAVPALTVNDLKEVTNNFGASSLIGEGSYGKVFYEVLKNGCAAAVKKLDDSNQPDDQFLAQVSMASRLKHQNFMELVGYCVQGNQRVLVCEFASNGSLHDILHGKKGVKGAQPAPVLSWGQRVKNCSRGSQES